MDDPIGERIHRSDRAVFRKLDVGAGGVILDVESTAYRRVNETGALIWSLLEDAPTREQLVGRVRDRISESPSDLAGEVNRFVDALAERKLVRLSRR